MNLLKWLIVALAALVALGLASCGGDDDGADQAADVGRHCELIAQLEQNAEEHFAQLDEGTTRAEFQQAHVDFIEENQPLLAELEETAPEEIREDGETVLAGMRAQAGEEVDVTEAEIDAADERQRQWEKENC